MKGHIYISNPVDEKGYVNWTEVENNTWKQLISRQKEIIKDKACDEFLHGLSALNFSDNVIPQIPDVNAVLLRETGWSIAPVPALIQPSEFFDLLANKKFPAATFIRLPEEKNYIKEPDIFHEIFGHTPLLTNQAYGDFMEKFGKLALKASPKERRRLFRLFWFTIEFGLLKTNKGLRAYGGGILSSIGESQYCLTQTPKKFSFNVLDALRTPYRIDIMQPLYFVIDKFEDLFSILDADILGEMDKSKELGEYPALFVQKSESSNKSHGEVEC